MCSKDNGIVLKSIKTASLKDYLDVIKTTVPPAEIISAGHVGPSKMGFFFLKEENVKAMAEIGTIVVNEQTLTVEPYIPAMRKIVMRGVPPFITNNEIKATLDAAGLKLIGTIKLIKYNGLGAEFAHIVSFTREALVTYGKDKIPDKISPVHDDVCYTVNIESGPKKCHKCGGIGHLSAACPNPQKVQKTLPTMGRGTYSAAAKSRNSQMNRNKLPITHVGSTPTNNIIVGTQSGTSPSQVTKTPSLPPLRASNISTTQGIPPVGAPNNITSPGMSQGKRQRSKRSRSERSPKASGEVTNTSKDEEENDMDLENPFSDEEVTPTAPENHSTPNDIRSFPLSNSEKGDEDRRAQQKLQEWLAFNPNSVRSELRIIAPGIPLDGVIPALFNIGRVNSQPKYDSEDSMSSQNQDSSKVREVRERHSSLLNFEFWKERDLGGAYANEQIYEFLLHFYNPKSYAKTYKKAAMSTMCPQSEMKIMVRRLMDELRGAPEFKPLCQKLCTILEKWPDAVYFDKSAELK